MHYMIHACEERRWYVYDFLIPSMTKQGISEDDIDVWTDWDHKGNLFSCMDSFGECGKRNASTWHLQDDVIISKDFYKRTKSTNPKHIVCGFCGKAFGPDPFKYGKVPNYEMWFSFPCIHIPDKFAGEFSKWFYEDCINRDRHGIQDRILDGKSDDWFWRRFIRECHPYTDIYNLKPNLVDHIDHFLGGSIINPKREKDTRAAWFEDLDLVEELGAKLKERQQGGV